MASTGKFTGIQKYNTIDIVDDWVNVIPIGDQLVDRLGSRIFQQLDTGGDTNAQGAASSWFELVCSNGDIIFNGGTHIGGIYSLSPYYSRDLSKPGMYRFRGNLKQLNKTNHNNCEMVEDTDTVACVYNVGGDGIQIITPGGNTVTRTVIDIKKIGAQGNSNSTSVTAQIPSAILKSINDIHNPSHSQFVVPFWNNTTNSKSSLSDDGSDDVVPVTEWDLSLNRPPVSSSNPNNIHKVIAWNFATEAAITIDDWYAWLNDVAYGTNNIDKTKLWTGLEFIIDTADQDALSMLVTWQNINGTPYATDSSSDLVSIDWFDNRIVLADKKDNRIWVSTSFPASDVLKWDANGNPSKGTFEQRWKITYWLDSAFTELAPYGTRTPYATWTDKIFPNWYSSTNSNNIINRVRQLNGNLYVLYSHSIECWVRTGEDDGPILINLNACMSVGGIECKVLNGIMYFIGVDFLNNRFVAKTSGDGQMERLSNNEIEKRIQNINQICHLKQRQDTFIGFYSAPTPATNDVVSPIRRKIYYIGERSGWWVWDNSHIPVNQYDYNERNPPDSCSWWLSSCIPVRSIIDDLIVYSNFQVTFGKFVDGARYDEIVLIIKNGTKDFSYEEKKYSIERSFIYGATDTGGVRTAVNMIQMVCDTGSVFDDLPEGDYPIECKMSFDNGRTWQKGLVRLLSQIGSNQKIMVWRNLGSGWQYMIKFTIDNEFPLLVRDINVRTS